MDSFSFPQKQPASLMIKGRRGPGYGVSSTHPYLTSASPVQGQGELKGLEAVVPEGGSSSGNVEGVRVGQLTEGREA